MKITIDQPTSPQPKGSASLVKGTIQREGDDPAPYSCQVKVNTTSYSAYMDAGDPIKGYQTSRDCAMGMGATASITVTVYASNGSQIGSQSATIQLS